MPRKNTEDNGCGASWVVVASRDHLERAVAGGFIQVCHGNGKLLARMRPNDNIALYASKETFGGHKSCSKFIAIGTVSGKPKLSSSLDQNHKLVDEANGVYVDEKTGFPRMLIDYDANFKEVPLKEPLLSVLSFIKNKKHWGMAFKMGHFKISHSDFLLIREKGTK